MRELRRNDGGPSGEQRGDDADAGPLPEGTEHVIVLHRQLRVTTGFEDEYPDGEAPDAVVYERGDEVPLPVARRCWDAFSDSLAALSGDSGERLDTPGRAEASGNFDAEPALSAWRRENNLQRTTIEVFRCGECGDTFETREALNGHQSKHTGGGRPTDGPDPETMADRLSDADADTDADAATDDDADAASDGDREGDAADAPDDTAMTDGGEPAPERVACPEPGCDFVGESKQAVTSHAGQVHRDPDDDPATPRETLLRLDAEDVPGDEVTRR